MWKKFKALKWWGKLAVVMVLWLALGGISVMLGLDKPEPAKQAATAAPPADAPAEAPPSRAEKALALSLMCGEIGNLPTSFDISKMTTEQMQYAVILGAAVKVKQSLGVDDQRALEILNAAFHEQLEKQGHDTSTTQAACNSE
ncbi:MAG: hypothetical protein ACHQZS_00725 [Candidatus Binatales bacterium]